MLLQIGAGTGLLFIVRWFWHRINPMSEIAAMAISFMVALFFFINGKQEVPWIEIAGHWQLIIGVLITTFGWVSVTLLTKPSTKETLDSFEKLIFDGADKFKNIGFKIVAFFAGIVGVYSFLFATGNWIYGETLIAAILSLLSCLCVFILIKIWKKIA